MLFSDKFKDFQSLYIDNTIVLRQVKPEHDAEEYFKILSDTDAFKYYGGDYAPPKSINDVVRELENQISEFRDHSSYTWTIAEKDTDKAIGQIHFSNFYNHNKAAGMGCYLNRAYWGKGIITACVNQIVEFGFEHLEFERIYAAIMLENIASWRTLEKNGFTREGILRHDFRCGNEFYDCYMYSKLYTD